ncbi:helix-turn-helix domain-containing protein [Novosphingobium sp. BL-8H]|uniref:helix-turn-helix domain-containing protein n=1 Tax=Novosphingobium sp. BL-8H TaxID=3127640 RepID=UPI003756C663
MSIGASTELPGILDARDDDRIVRARIVTSGITVELCDFPRVRRENLVTCTSETVVSLGLSPLLPGASGRYGSGPYSRFAQLGALVLRPAGIPLEFRHAGGEFTSIRCRFASSELLKAPDAVWTDAELEACLQVNDPRAEYTMLRLAEECDRMDEYSPRIVAALAETLLTDLARYLDAVRARASYRRGGLPASQLRRIAEYVENSASAPSVSELASLCGLSPTHLMRAFRQSTGKSVAKYVEGNRISKAKALLAETTLPISVIATRLGFSSATAFSQIFRRATGQTPRHYRNWIG